MTIIKSLARAHQKQAVNSCNGEGFIRGQRYYNGKIDDYARRTYGHDVKSAYQGDSDEAVDVFMLEQERIETRLINEIELMNRNLHEKNRIKLELQGDPRGATVKLNIKGQTFCPEWEF